MLGCAGGQHFFNGTLNQMFHNEQKLFDSNNWLLFHYQINIFLTKQLPSTGAIMVQSLNFHKEVKTYFYIPSKTYRKP